MDTLACSEDARFLLARAFRWGREAASDEAVEFTLIANTVIRAAGSSNAADLSKNTTPGFHSRLAIASGTLAYAVQDEELAGDLPLKSTLSGRVPQQVSSQAALASPAATAKPPFAIGDAGSGEQLALIIAQAVRPGGLDYSIELKTFAGSATTPKETRSLTAMEVTAGMLTGLAKSNAGGNAAPIEYVIRLRLCVAFAGKCTTSRDCCNDVPCISGRCRFP